MGIKLWVDDERIAPDGWTWATDYKEAIDALEMCSVHPKAVSLDHDLGLGKSGYYVALWMAEHNFWPIRCVAVHSHNPVGARNICAVVDRYGPYDQRCIWTPYGSYRHAQILDEWGWLS